MRPSPRQAGFTLIEVLVAMAILSLAVVASIQGFAQGLRLLKLSGDHQNAMLLADQKMREVVEPKEGRDGGTEGLLSWERNTRLLDTPDLNPAGATSRGKIYEIDVRVNWEARRHVEVRTLRLVTPETGQTAIVPPGTVPGTTPTKTGPPSTPVSPFGGPTTGTPPRSGIGR